MMRKRFRVFVANRIQKIHEYTSPLQWNRIGTAENPSDYASRGIRYTETEKVKLWLQAPKMLWGNIENWNKGGSNMHVADDDVELKTPVTVNMTEVTLIEKDILNMLLLRISSWKKLKRVMCYILKFIQSSKGVTVDKELTVDNMVEAERRIFKLDQKKYLAKEIEGLQQIENKNRKERKATLKKCSSLLKLDPFLDEEGLIRVGGRLKNSCQDYQVIHPIIISKHSPVSDLVVRSVHADVAHSGRDTTLNSLRNRGFWVINANAKVRKLIEKCVEKLFTSACVLFEKRVEKCVENSFTVSQN